MEQDRVDEKPAGGNSRPTACSAYCPNCQHDLCNEGNLESDDKDGVKYRCAYCGQRSVWNFDAPLPLLIKAVGAPTIIMDYRGG